MKKAFLIFSIGLLAACTKKSPTTTPITPTTNDTTFNGSYVTLTVNGRTFHEKDALYNGHHYVTLSAVVENKFDSALVSHPTLTLAIGDLQAIYGLRSQTMICAWGSGVGTYQLNNIYDVVQDNPLNTYTPVSGTETITHDGSDYIEGTINGTCKTSSGSYLPVTGSFKIFR